MGCAPPLEILKTGIPAGTRSVVSPNARESSLKVTVSVTILVELCVHRVCSDECEQSHSTEINSIKTKTATVQHQDVCISLTTR